MGRYQAKSQTGSLESIILDGAKRILGDMGLDTLQHHRDRAKLNSKCMHGGIII